MNSQRLKQLRLARGLSLEALAAELGGVVTKQALSKYEQGRSQPTSRILTKLASALGVKAAQLFSEPDINVQFIAYRKASRLPKREQQRIEGWVSQNLEERVRLQQLIHPESNVKLPIMAFSVSTVEEVEQSAEHLRGLWQMGLDLIASVARTFSSARAGKCRPRESRIPLWGCISCSSVISLPGSWAAANIS